MAKQPIVPKCPMAGAKLNFHHPFIFIKSNIVILLNFLSYLLSKAHFIYLNNLFHCWQALSNQTVHFQVDNMDKKI